MKLKIIWHELFAKYLTNPPRILGATIGLFFLLFLSCNYLVMPLYTRHWQVIRVPEVTHMSATAAEKLLQKRGLKAIKSDEKYDENYPPGFVLFQNPEPGTPVKKGRRIYLTLGKGLRVFEMPKLTGNSERDAKFILNQHDLKLGEISYRNDDFYPSGVVCAQSLPVGREVGVGEIIDFVVSLGDMPSEFIVPQVTGKTLEEALLSIRKAGLTIGEIEYQENHRLLPNTVLGQSIEPGLQVSMGDTLNLSVSKLPDSSSEDKRW